MPEIYLRGAAGTGGGLRKKKEDIFIRAAGDVERYKPPKTKNICVTWNKRLAKL